MNLLTNQREVNTLIKYRRASAILAENMNSMAQYEMEIDNDLSAAAGNRKGCLGVGAICLMMYALNLQTVFLLGL